MQQVNLSEKSLIELKALAYDIQVELNFLTRNAQIIEQEIIKRTSTPEQPQVSKELKPLKDKS